ESIITDWQVTEGPGPICWGGGYGFRVRACARPGMTGSTRQRHFLVGAADPVVVGVGEPGVDLARRAGLAEAITLHRMHAGGAQEEMLLRRFDAFRGDLHAETAAETDHGMNDGCGVRRFFDRAHEAGVDLELVEREAAQIEQ